MIRLAEKSDFKGISHLFDKYQMKIPTLDELFSGAGYVSIEDDKVVGFIWALHAGCLAYVNYLVVDEDHRAKAQSGHSLIGIELGIALFTDLARKGITRFYTMLGNRPYMKHLFMVYRDILGMEEMSTTYSLMGKPQIILERLEAIND